MSIITSLYAICNANAAVAALLGAGDAMQLYPKDIPQGQEGDAATYSTVGGMPANTFDAAAPADNLRISFNYQSIDFDRSQAGAEALRRAFEDQNALIAQQLGAQCVSINPDDFDEDRRQFIASFDMSFWQSR
jgi:hypothetical protein